MSDFQIVDVLWLTQAALALLISAGFGVIVVRAIRVEWRSHQHIEHGSIMAMGLLIIALANVLTAFATAAEPDLVDLRNWAGTVVRGSLLILVIYMLALGPFDKGSKT